MSRPGRGLRPPVLHLMSAVLFMMSFQAWGSAALRPACAADANHAGMVIRFSSSAESQRSWCLQFSQESISGMDALRLTGLPVVTKGYGSQGEYVCKIGDVGTDAADCPAKDGGYWGYWRMTSQGWRHSGIGASSARVRCGSLEGWAWLQGGTGPAPDAAQFSSICTSAACKAAPSVISAPPAGPSDPDPQPATISDPDAGPGGDPAPDNPAGPPVSTNGAQRDPALPRRQTGSTDALRAEPGTGPEKVPFDEKTTGGPQAPQTEAAGNSRGVSDSAMGAGRSRAAASRRPWGIYGALAGLIVVLAAVRAYLFWGPGGRGKPGP